MSLGAGALKVEGPIAQNGSIASEVTMATKRAPTPKNTSDPGAWRPEGPREWVPWDLRDPQHPKHPESLAQNEGKQIKGIPGLRLSATGVMKAGPPHRPAGIKLAGYDVPQ